MSCCCWGCVHVLPVWLGLFQRHDSKLTGQNIENLKNSKELTIERVLLFALGRRYLIKINGNKSLVDLIPSWSWLSVLLPTKIVHLVFSSVHVMRMRKSRHAQIYEHHKNHVCWDRPWACVVCTGCVPELGMRSVSRLGADIFFTSNDESLSN